MGIATGETAQVPPLNEWLYAQHIIEFDALSTFVQRRRQQSYKTVTGFITKKYW